MRPAVITFLLFVLSETYALPNGCQWHEQNLKKIRLQGLKCDRRARLDEVPSDFAANINYLEFDGQRFSNLTVSSFAHYPQLQYLILRNNKIGHIEEETFLSLTKLVHLDLSENPIEDLPPLPSSIEALSLNFMANPSAFFNSSQTMKNILELDSSLKILLIQNNRLQVFPAFIKKLVSINEIDVDANHINNLTIDDVAPLCNLKALSFTDNTIASSEEAACNCQFVHKWALQHNVKIYNLTCPKIPSLDYNECVVKFPQNRALQDRAYIECRDETWLRKHLFYCIFGMMAVVVVIGLCFVSWSQKKTWKRVSVSSTIEEIPKDANIPLKEMEE